LRLRALRLFLIAIGVILFVSIAAAADLPPSTLTSSNTGWLLADGNDQATITAHVMQAPASADVAGASVAFSLAADSLGLGTLSSASGVTGTDGIAQTVFTAGTRSGTANILAVVTYNDGTVSTITLTCAQKIDHTLAYRAVPEYAGSVPAGSVTRLTLTLLDVSDNPVDNGNPAEVHSVQLHMSGNGGAGFLNGGVYVPDLAVPTDASGKVAVDLRVSTAAGPNVIQVYPVGSYLGELVTIAGVADSDPCYLFQVRPSPSSYPADGKDPDHRFVFYWTVRDKFGNPIENADLYVTSSKGEEVHLATDTGGLASTPYGPKDVAGVYTITAKPVVPGTTTGKNATILCMDTGTTGSCLQTVEYTPMDPVDMILTASPQTMVSMDVAGAKAVDVKARVVDVAGNTVIGETVTFTKSPDSVGTFVETVPSSLTPPTTLQTSTDTGYAIVQFVPGTFARKGETGYMEAATGSCKVSAQWTNPKNGETKTREITFVWKNYPFLTVESEVDQENPKVGDSINVKIWIRGTGAALQPKPIDVMLVMDRSGSMDGARIASAKTAANQFIEKMRLGNGNQVGLVSFASDTTKDQTLTSDYDAVKSKVTNLHATGATQMRRGLYEAIAELSQEGRSDAIKAVILLTDGDWNYDGSILAHGTGWPKDSPGYTFSGNTLEPDNYRYYDGLGGTTATLCTDYGYSCDVCNAGYHLGTTWWTSGKCCPDGGGTCYSAYDRPGWCAQRHCNEYNTVCQNGEFTTQNMSVYAGESTIRLYALSFESSPSEYVQNALTTMTTSTKGYYKHAPDSTQLGKLYDEIAGELNEQAGGKTQLVADFSSLTVDGSLVSGAAAGNYLDYQYAPDEGTSSSTFVKKYTEVPVTPAKNYYYSVVRDDRGNWTDPTAIPGLTPKKLEFDVGKIILNDVWTTNIRFKLTGAGQIGIFGENSPVTFIDSVTGKSQTVTVPYRSWTTHLSTVDNPFASPVTLEVTNVKIVPDTTDPDIWITTWDTTYDGSKVVHQKLLICSVDGTDPVSCSTPHTAWLVYEKTPDDIAGSGHSTTTPGLLRVDTGSLKPGKNYQFTIWVETYGEKENSGQASRLKDAGSQRSYIRLE
jgi:hypothetical protein